MIIKAIATGLLFAAFLGWSFVKFRKLFATIRVGRAEPLTDNPAERATRVLQMVFFHKKVLESPVSGFMHIFFLYGFLVLGIGHMELVLAGLTAPLTPDTQTGWLYEMVLPDAVTHFYHLSQDFMAAAVVVMSVVALVRRFSGTVDRLMPRSLDAEIILWFILFLYVTFFLFVGAHSGFLMKRQALEATWQWWQPVSSLIAMQLMQLDDNLLWTLREVGFWTHLVIFLAFGAYIPVSKHMHLVFAGPNIYFHKKHWFAHEEGAPKNNGGTGDELAAGMGLPPSIDFMDENLEKYGIDKVYEYSWKTLLDTFACTECGRCNAVCPAHLSGKPLQPKKVLHDLKDNLRYKNAESIGQFYDAWGNLKEDKKEEFKAYEPEVPLINRDEIDHSDKNQVREDGKYLNVDGQIHLDEAWACTTCAACVTACPVLIDSVPGSLIGIRQNMVMMEADFAQELNSTFKGLENQGNPWGVGQDKRQDWIDGLDVPVLGELEEDKDVEYLFWVGCAGATDDRAKKTQQSMVRILKQSNVDFAILGCEETCVGDPARRLGNEYVYDALAQTNVATLNGYQEQKKFKKIFTTCPHCFNSLSNEYKDLGGDYSVQHHTELLSELMKDKRIPQDDKKAIEQKVTFHDPCYLGRYNEKYDEPRDVLVQLKGVTVTEMERNQKQSFCCGAGGGRMWMEEHIGDRVNVMRTEQAQETGADTVAVGCPFCMTMMTDGTKAKDIEETMQVKDVAELVAERLPDA